jgi:DNA end-binding protein Ku
MPRSMWKGTISFGLVTIPVSLMPSVAQRDLAFHLLDSEGMSPVHNLRVNSEGEEVPWERIVKGYELPDGRWVTMSEEDFKAANVKATQTIDVLGAVCAEEIPLRFFDTPYYLAPEKAGVKAYALLREALKHAGRIAIGQIVIRTRQHLCALVPDGDMLMLEVLRYPHELRSADDVEVPGDDLAALGVTDAEVALAEQLVTTIAASWDPESYRDTYHDDLLALIEQKAKGGTVEIPEKPKEIEGAEVVDIMSLLKQSLEDKKAAEA